MFYLIQAIENQFLGSYGLENIVVAEFDNYRQAEDEAVELSYALVQESAVQDILYEIAQDILQNEIWERAEGNEPALTAEEQRDFFDDALCALMDEDVSYWIYQLPTITKDMDIQALESEAANDIESFLDKYPHMLC